MYKIFVIEDDSTTACMITAYLADWGYFPKACENFQDPLPEITNFSPQLILLDISLPFRNGFFWCKEIRKFSKVPIIFVSSASDNMNIVIAMDEGGDDFITKPFDTFVLMAKIQAMLRRTYEFEKPSDILEFNNVFLSLNDMNLTFEDKKVSLTKNEFKILQILMDNKNSVVRREDIMVKLWESDFFVDDNTLTVNITRLRKKISDIGLSNFIITKKNIGYMVGK